MLEVKKYDQEEAETPQTQIVDTDHGFETRFGPEDVLEVTAGDDMDRLKRQGKILMALFVGIVAITYVCARALWVTNLAIYDVVGDKMVSPELALRAARRCGTICKVLWMMEGFFLASLGYYARRFKSLRLSSIIALIGIIIIPNILIEVTQIAMDHFGLEQMMLFEKQVLGVGLFCSIFVVARFVIWHIKVVSWIED